MVNVTLASKRPYLKVFQYILVSFFILFLVLVVLQQANPLNTRLERDSGIYIYVSNTFLKGGLPYVTAMETKPPGIFFIDAFALWIGDGTRWGIWAVEFLFLFFATCIGFYFLNLRFDFGPALLGTVIWIFGLSLTLEGGNLTEEYSLIFGFTSLLLWTLSENKPNNIWFDVGIGLCAGFSALLRPNNTGVQIAIVISIILLSVLYNDSSKLPLRLAVLGFFALVPFVLSGYYFYSQGAFREFLNASFLYNFSYTGGNFNLRSAIIKGIGSLGFSVGVGSVGYFIAVGCLYRQYVQRRVDSIYLWLVISGLLELVLSGLSGKAFQHYFICWLPAIAVSTSILARHTFPFFCYFSKRYFSWVLTAAIFSCLVLYSNVFVDYADTVQKMLNNRFEISSGKEDSLVQYVKAHTLSGDLLLVWGGQAGINYQSGRDAPTPYIFYPLFAPSEISKRWSYEYYQDIRESMPVFIIDGSCFASGDLISISEENPQKWILEHSVHENSYLVEVLGFIKENYSLKDIVNGCSIYKLKVAQD